MSLSVIMPNYNHAARLPRSLRALISQVPPADEIIIVDDGSTDESVSVIEGFQACHPHIRLIRHATNRGVTAAIQTALDAACGEFLIGGAAGDFVLPGLFAHALAALQAHPQAALFCAEVVVVDGEDSIFGFRPSGLPRSTGGYVSPGDARRALRHSDNWFAGPSVIYRRARLAEIGGFDRTLGALSDGMANRLLACRYGFCFEPKVLAAWRLDPESFSARSALSPTESARLIDGAKKWIDRYFPDDIRDNYRQKFDRRTRFSMARIRLVWAKGKLDWAGIADLMQWRAFDRGVLRLLASVPLLSASLALVWMVIRTRPFGSAVVAQMLWRNLTVNRTRRRELNRTLRSVRTAGPQQ
jgi:glycosyltransferase involved in cell wall biosynthesis